MDTEKIFFDTNIVLDILDINRLNHTKSKTIWEKLIINKSTILISEDMLSTIFYLNQDKKYTLEFFKLIYKRWEIVAFGNNVIKNATDLSLENNLDLEDTLQCLCAKENGCTVLLTNDKKFYDCGMDVMSSEAFLKSLN